MKIGIITFHHAYNYGAVLQCYALLHVIKNMGHDIEIINYAPNYFRIQNHVFSFYSMKYMNIFGKIEYVLNAFKNYKIKKSRIQNFYNFISKLPLSKEFSNPMFADLDNYDAIVFGSDQIWNPKITVGFDRLFYGLFNKRNSLFISYAASSQKKEILNYKKEFSKLIERFDSISVRESWFKDFFDTLKSGCAQLVLDPVLLLSADQWSSLSSKDLKEKYVLIYMVPQNDLSYQVASLIAKNRNLKIIELVANVKDSNKGDIVQDASPAQFVAYFKNAEFVVTTSFHGTSFSIIFNKSFYTISCGSSIDERSASLLEQVCLSNRLISSLPQTIENIDSFVEVNERLDKLRKKSNDFLIKSFNKTKYENYK